MVIQQKSIKLLPMAKTIILVSREGNYKFFIADPFTSKWLNILGSCTRPINC